MYAAGMDPYGDIKGMMEGPDVPDAPEPEAPVEMGDEGIRQGEMARLHRQKVTQYSNNRGYRNSMDEIFVIPIKRILHSIGNG